MADASHGAPVSPNFSSGAIALAAALALYLGLTGVLLWLSLARTGGEFVYAQDDPYIHLAMARTLAEDGVWGVRSYEFASASSSPLWTVLLAAIWKAGLHQTWPPFALNLAFGCGLLVYVSRQLQTVSPPVDPDLSPRVIVPPIAVLMALVLVTPLPMLAFIGMEHTLQALLAVAFTWQVAVRLAGERDDWVWPSLLAGLMAATRYESLFLVLVAGALLAWQKRWRPALAIGAAAALPLLVFGWYSLLHGGLVLPNSVLMKSGPSRFGSLASGLSAVLSDWVAVGALFRRPAQLALTIAVAIAFLLVPAERLERRRTALWMGACFLGTSLLHACLVKLEWFYRYEAYLVALGIVAVAMLVDVVAWPRGTATRRRQRLHPAVLPLAVLLVLPLGERALGALAVVPAAVRNVYEQQVQLGRFFARHYPRGSIAVNDLGAVAWLSTSRILDIVGLASQDVADLKRRRALTAEALHGLAEARNVEAIAVYEDIFAPILPAGWVKAGEWTIGDNVAVSGTIVAFFGPDDRSAERLRQALEAFAVELPAGVKWTPNGQRLPSEVSSRP